MNKDFGQRSKNDLAENFTVIVIVITSPGKVKNDLAENFTVIVIVITSLAKSKWGCGKSNCNA